MRGFGKIVGLIGTFFGILVGIVKLSNECEGVGYVACVLRAVGLAKGPPENGQQPSMPSQPSVVLTPIDPETVYWNTVKDSRNIDEFRSYIAKYPNGRFVEIANLRINALGIPVPMEPPSPPPQQAPPPQPPQKDPRDALLAFVENELLGSSHPWAAVVDFYGTPGLSRSEVIRRREGFFASCPHRRFDVVTGTFRVQERGGGAYRVRFCYSYNHSCRNGPASGTAAEDIDVRATGGGYEITRSLHSPRC